MTSTDDVNKQLTANQFLEALKKVTYEFDICETDFVLNADKNELHLKAYVCLSVDHLEITPFQYQSNKLNAIVKQFNETNKTNLTVENVLDFPIFVHRYDSQHRRFSYKPLTDIRVLLLEMSQP